MKALWAVGIPKTWDHRMMLNYLALGQVQNPADKSQTFFDNISSLAPGQHLFYDAQSGKTEVTSYWGINKNFQKEIRETDAVSITNQLLSASVKQRLRSDVPTGGSLSGGIDSAGITWHALQHRPQHHTFSAVFPGQEGDESARIAELLACLPHKNETVTPSGDEMIHDLEKLAWHQEEPFSSTSVYAQFRVHRLAAERGIKVLLDGQGADEIFAGYPRYAHWYLQDLMGHKKWLAASRELTMLKRNHIPFHWGVKNILASFLPSHASITLEKKEYRKIIRHPEITREYLHQLKEREWEGISKPYVTQLNDILYFNTFQMGLEEMLRFADRNSMANGIETRLPYLQPDLVEFIFSLPSKFKIRDGNLKWILRKSLENKLPDGIVWNRIKTGFETPQKEWMSTNKTMDFVHECMKFLVNEKILKPSVLKRKQHPMGPHDPDNYDWRYLVAALLMKK
jgi:asparagine synthase (glutamine-hydrolysing)